MENGTPKQWSLQTSGRYTEVVINSGLTVLVIFQACVGKIWRQNRERGEVDRGNDSGGQKNRRRSLKKSNFVFWEIGLFFF